MRTGLLAVPGLRAGFNDQAHESLEAPSTIHAGAYESYDLGAGLFVGIPVLILRDNGPVWSEGVENVNRASGWPVSNGGANA